MTSENVVEKPEWLVSSVRPLFERNGLPFSDEFFAGMKKDVVLAIGVALATAEDSQRPTEHLPPLVQLFRRHDIPWPRSAKAETVEAVAAALHALDSDTPRVGAFFSVPESDSYDDGSRLPNGLRPGAVERELHRRCEAMMGYDHDEEGDLIEGGDLVGQSRPQMLTDDLVVLKEVTRLASMPDRPAPTRGEWCWSTDGGYRFSIAESRDEAFQAADAQAAEYGAVKVVVGSCRWVSHEELVSGIGESARELLQERAEEVWSGAEYPDMLSEPFEKLVEQVILMYLRKNCAPPSFYEVLDTVERAPTNQLKLDI